MMKKVLSTILAMAMLLSLAAPMASAEVVANETPITVSATDATVIEAEEYATYERTGTESGAVDTVTLEPQTNTLADGTEVSFVRTNDMGVGTVVQTLAISVEQAGTYDVEIITADADWVSRPIVAIDGATPYYYAIEGMDTEIINKPTEEDTAAGETVAEKTILYYFGSESFPAKKKVFETELSQGNHTLTLTYDMSATTNTAVAFATDHVKFTPKTVSVPTTEVGAEGGMIEVENYKDAAYMNGFMKVPGTVMDHASASGGKALRFTDILVGAEVNIVIPVNVAKAGWYNVETVASTWNSGQYHSPATIKTEKRGVFMNNGKEYFVEDLSADIEDENGKKTHTFFDYNYGASRYEGRTFLDVGKQNLTVHLTQRTFDGKTCYIGDYIKLTPMEVQVTAVSATEPTKIEYEDYTDCATVAMNVITEAEAPGTLASGGAFLQVDTDHRESDVYIDIPVAVERSGFYNVHAVTSNLCPTNIGVNGNVTRARVGAMLGEEQENKFYTYFALKHYAAFETTSSIYLPAGKQTVTTMISRRKLPEGGVEKLDVAGAYDYITLTPVATPEFTVSAEETSGLSFSDYMEYAVLDNAVAVKGTLKNHAKGDYLELREIDATDGIYIRIPTKVEQSGWYNMASVLSLHSSSWVSEVQILVDDRLVLKNKKAYSTEDLSLDAEGSYDYVSKDYPMHRFENVCYLEEGFHEITVYAKKRTSFVANEPAQVENAAKGIFRTCFLARELQLTPVIDTAVYANNAVSISAHPVKDVSGTTYITLYQGAQLVALGTGALSEAGFIEATIPCTEAPDTVKVFTWSDLNSLKPQTFTKVITVE